MDRYEKIRVIGQGAFGKVFLCRRKVEKNLVVIKQIPVDELQKEERKAALNEVDVLQMLKHPTIIAYYDSFVEEKSLMIAMEYAPGGTLHEFIQDRDGTLLEEEHILKFFAQLLVAIEHVHSLKILHRDLKTQNILMNKKRTVLKIGDFGISKVLSSKITSAQTVVGTPCYISPEICEGRLYAEKSDIWALGCILYELTTLKKAFEGPNLPALVLKIMQASTALEPIHSRYSQYLWQLICSLLQRYAKDRPSIQSAMANPIMVNALLNLCTDIGRVPCRSAQVAETLASDSGGFSYPSSQGSLKTSQQRSFYPVGHETGSWMSSRPQVYCWGGGVNLVPGTLPRVSDSKITSVAVGRTQRAGVTEEGKLIFWELSSGSLGTTRFTMQPQARKREPVVFVPQVVGGFSTAFIKKVACGDMFTACLTDKGILMTFGSGVNGCLGHGDYDDTTEPKLVHSMLAHETTEVACGANHVIAITTDNSVFAWGKGDSGQLGLGTRDSYPTPQAVKLPGKFTPSRACCGPECSILLTERGEVLATGSNRYNKLSLDGSFGEEASAKLDKMDPEMSFTPASLQPEQLGGRQDQQQQSQENETPAILSLMKGTPNLMSSSLILSSIHARRKGRGDDTSGAARSLGRSDGGEGLLGGGGLRGRKGSVQQPGAVDEVSVFRQSGSDLLNSKKMTAVSMGTNHTAFLTDGGECLTCGSGSHGQLGYPWEKGERTPALVEGELSGKTAEKVACGDFFTVAATTDGKLYSWGHGRRGRLGRESEENVCQPQQVVFESPHSVQSLACSHGVTMLLATPT